MTTPLAAYMTEAGINDAEFADVIGRDRSFVNKLRRGVIRPTLDLAATIESLTGGAIPMQAWTVSEPDDPVPFPTPTRRTVETAPGPIPSPAQPNVLAPSAESAGHPAEATSTSATTTCSTCSPNSLRTDGATRPSNDAIAPCPACDRASPADVVACTAVDCALREREAA